VTEPALEVKKMFREIRNKDRELSVKRAEEILANGCYGILAVAGDDGYPYGSPLHYALIDGEVHFHGSVNGGYRAECLAKNPKVSFTVVESENGIDAESVIVFGQIEVLDGMSAVVLEKLVEKFVPPFAWEQAKTGIAFGQHGVQAYRLKAEHMSAKYVKQPDGQ
jgi:nitroimidazol reductase NimA-like FMN-containing flavoprotein (pyridoxamine 5'-phosphate oxidase superfamily)